MAEFKEIIINRPNFLASKVGLRVESTTAKADNAQVVTENGRKVLKAGTIYPSNDTNAVGIIYQDVDVTDGDTAAPIMVAGYYFKDRLVGSLNSAAETAFKGKGLFGENYSDKASVRPDFGGAFELTKLSAPVANASGKVISWSKVTNASGYNVYETTSGKVLVATLNANATSYTSPKTSSGTYKYKLESIGDNIAYETSDLSTEVSVTVS